MVDINGLGKPPSFKGEHARFLKWLRKTTGVLIAAYGSAFWPVIEWVEDQDNGITNEALDRQCGPIGAELVEDGHFLFKHSQNRTSQASQQRQTGSGGGAKRGSTPRLPQRPATVLSGSRPSPCVIETFHFSAFFILFLKLCFFFIFQIVCIFVHFSDCFLMFFNVLQRSCHVFTLFQMIFTFSTCSKFPRFFHFSTFFLHSGQARAHQCVQRVDAIYSS